MIMLCIVFRRLFVCFESSNLAVIFLLVHSLSSVSYCNETRYATVVGDFAYTTAAWCDTFEIYNVSNPNAIVKLGHMCLPPNNPFDIKLVGNYAYVADGLTVINIANPASPYQVIQINPGTFAHGIDVVDNYVYLVGEILSSYGAVPKFNIYSIVNPESPVLIGQVATSSSQKVRVVGNYAYVADGPAGLKIINITNRANPSIVGSVESIGSASNLDVYSHYVYVALGSNGSLIIDVSNPSNPVLVGEIDTSIGGTVVDVKVSNDFVYVLDNSSVGVIRVFDISNPASPVLLYTEKVGSSMVSSFSIANNRIYVACGSDHLKILTPTLSPTPTESLVPWKTGAVVGSIRRR